MAPTPRYGVPPEELAHVTHHSQECMERWRGARILVTGATGFFGQWLVETFHHANQALGLGAELVGIGGPTDDFSQQCPHLLGLPGVRLVRADICHLDALMKTEVPDWDDRIDAIIHAAIYVDNRTYSRQPMPTLETCVKGTWEVLALALRTKTQRFLFISSGAVYGTQPADLARIGETHSADLDCAQSRSAYAEGKRFCETLACGFWTQHGLEVTIARPFAFVGPHLPIDRHFAIGNFLRDALANQAITIESDGRPVRSYMYAADLAIWLWTILARGAPGRAYNVGAEQALTLKDAAALVAQLAGNEAGVIVKGSASDGPAPRYVPDTSRAAFELGLQATFSLEEGIRRTLAWHRRQS